MNRRHCLLAVMLVLLLPAFVSAADSSQGSGEMKGRWGFLFDAKNILELSGFEDGYQAGAGVKYWAAPTIAVRALLGVAYDNPKESDISTTTLGLGIAGEWHPKKGVASPYLGPLFGLRMLAQTEETTYMDLYFGGIFGAEVKILDNISFFAEYELLASINDEGFSLHLGVNDSGAGQALLGLIIYF